MRQHGWLVFIGGLILALIGVYGMWAGWEHIQLERGWAQFIAGAVGVSGGVVTMALGRVIRAIGRLVEPGEERAGKRAVQAPVERPSEWPNERTSERTAERREERPVERLPETQPPEPPRKPPAKTPPQPPRAAAADPFQAELTAAIASAPRTQPQRPTAAALKEVDRYVAGEAEYVMYSDGSVEVRSGGNAERYPSLAALRAEAERRNV